MKKVFFILLLFLLFLIFNQSRLKFISSSIHISLYQEVDPLSYIKNKINAEDISFKHNVDTTKVGHYYIHYAYKHKNYTLDVYVEDTYAPTFDVVNKKILINQQIDPSSLIKNLKDDSPTTIYFKEDYVFNELKTYQVSIVVEDAYHNRTIKDAYVLVEEKDVLPPTLKGIENLSILQGDEIDLKEGVIISDDYDLNPSYTIDDTSLNIHKIGQYQIYYDVIDASLNKHRYIRKIEVLSQYDDRKAINDSKKICYLTFDDGPSSNTIEILKILKAYQIHATFFVCGTNKQYIPYIKEAYNEGHMIGLHSYSHDYERIYSSLSSYLKDLNKIKELVYQQTGMNSSVIRFPGGSSNLVSKQYNEGIMKRVAKKVIDLGYQYYDWNVINGDGENIESVDGLINKVKEEIKGKEDIMVLMHDSGACVNTVKALPTILDMLIKQGYEFKIIEKYSPTFHHSIQN